MSASHSEHRDPNLPLSGRSRRALVLALLLLSVGSCAIPRWPVSGRTTSEFGIRFRGVWPDIHRGVDIYVPEGTPVHAMSGGRVRFAGTMSGFGNVVWLDHGGDVLSVYAHLSSIDVQPGDPVADRQVIGASGMTGDATGPHLHFEVWRWGRERDPVQLLGGYPTAR